MEPRWLVCSLLLAVFALAACSAPPSSLIDDDAGGGEQPPIVAPAPDGAVWEVRAHRARVHDLAWSPDGSLLAVAAMDSVTIVLEREGAETFDWRARMTGPLTFRSNPQAIAWSADGAFVAVPGLVRNTDTWDRELEFMESGRNSDALAFSPDGRWLAGGSRPTGGGQEGGISFVLWDARTGGEVYREPTPADPFGVFQGYVTDVSWSPDGTRVAVASTFAGFVVNVDRRTVERRLPPAGAIAWSPDGRAIALAGPFTRMDPGEQPGLVQVIDAATGGSLAARVLHEGRALSVAWHPDGKRLYSVGADKVVAMVDAATLEEVASVNVDAPAAVVRVAPDGDTVAVGTESGFVYLLPQALTGSSRRTPIGGGRIYALALSPDERYVVTGGFDGKLRVWSAHSGALVAERHVGGHVLSVDWSGDGAWIAVVGDQATVYRADDLRYHATLLATDARGVAFAPGGDRVALTSWSDPPVRVIDMATMSLLWQYDRSMDAIPLDWPDAPAWSPDGRSLSVHTFQGPRLHVFEPVATETGRGGSVRVLRPPVEVVLAHGWSHGGARLVIGGGDEGGFQNRTVAVLDALSGEVLAEQGYASAGWTAVVGFTKADDAYWAGGAPDRVVFSGPDLGTGDGLSLKVWDAATGELRGGLHEIGTVGAVALSHDDAHVVVGTWSGMLSKRVLP